MQIKAIAKPLAAVGLALSMSLSPALASATVPTAGASTLSPSQTPAFMGGRLHGSTTQTQFIEGYGRITATINNDTGQVTTVHPDGSVTKTNIEVLAKDLQARLKDATPQQIAMVKATAQSRVSKEDVCPYLVTAVGTIHGFTWAEVLSMAAVNPAIAGIAALGEAFFWTWVGSHC